MQWQMQSLIISTYSINYHYPHSFISSSHSTSPATTATATATACMQHACFHTCTLSIVWSEHKHHRASSCSLFEILNQPKQKEQNIAIPECGRERCGNIFTTRPATYLLHVLLRAKYLQVLLSVSIPIISGLVSNIIFRAWSLNVCRYYQG